MYIPFGKDTLQKLSLIAFAQAILAMMGDKRKVVRFYPTELIIPTFRHRFMDGVLELDDGVLINVEFQTGDLTEKFLLRCAQYAVNLRVISRKFVETSIISTGNRNKSKLIAFISKFFLFKPKIFFYSEYDGLEILNNIKDKIENKEKLTLLDHYYLVFIPFMGNVNQVEVAFEVFRIANNRELFSAEEQSEIKKCQYVVAQIVANGDKKLFNKFWEIIMWNNDFLVEYEENLIKETTENVTQQVTEQVTQQVTMDVSKNIAKNLKDVLSDEEIAKCTGLSLKTVKGL
ncbi:hypothetical protein [Methanobrevibacter sp.]|uniref:hypothetical protein n=1 Tax=Methanobrevibacter sp. TaxID=66852 RepID=UPI00386908EA